MSDRADDDVAFALRLVETCKRGVSMPEEAHRAIEHALAGEIERLRQQRAAALALIEEWERLMPAGMGTVSMIRQMIDVLGAPQTGRAALDAADEPTTGGGEPS